MVGLMYNINGPKGTRKVLFYVLLFVCFCTNISQLPYFVENEITQYISQPLWGFLVISVLFSFGWKSYERYLYIIILYLSLTVLLMAMDTFLDGKYLSSSIFVNLSVSIAVFLVGTFFSNVGIRDIDKLLKTYLYSSFLVSSFVFFGYFLGKGSLDTTTYAYASKNSIALIVLTAILIICYFNRIEYSENYCFLITTKVMGVFLIITLFALRSRAVILPLMIIGLYYFVRFVISNKIPKNKILILVIVLIPVAVFLFWNFDFFFYNILLAGRSPDSLNDISSGRIDILMSFPSLIEGRYLTGIGDLYFECYPLSAFLNFGIPIGSYVLILSCIPLWSLTGIGKRNVYYLFFTMMLFAYYTNSLFEGLAPIGPGAKCYFLWLLAGILYRNKKLSAI